MTFEDFAKLHGVIVGRLIPGKWVRVATEDKPRSRNGAYKFLGDVGFVQNWATQTEAATWRAEGASTDGQRRVQAIANQAIQEAAANARKAALKASYILSECELAPHPYLASKGFPDEMVNVWNRETDNVMVVPMRIGRNVVGCQLIKPDGDKKFLFGQRSGGAEFVMGQKGSHVLCEGFATGLSVQQAMRNLKLPYVLHVCFSAGGMKKVAANLPTGLVIADNDPSKICPHTGRQIGMAGERAAQEIGWPYWMSDVVGEDFNDAHQRLGLFPLVLQLRSAMLGANRRRA